MRERRMRMILEALHLGLGRLRYVGFLEGSHAWLTQDFPL